MTSTMSVRDNKSSMKSGGITLYTTDNGFDQDVT